MDIHVAADFVCPWCYVGKRQLEHALAARPACEARLQWLPFQLNPDMPAEGMDHDQFMTEHFGTPDVSDMHDKLRAIGEADGVDFQFEKIRRVPNTLNAHRLVRFAAPLQKGEAVTEALFKANFTDGEDIGEIDVLCRIAGDVGLNTDGMRQFLESDRGLEEVKTEETLLRQMGISGVPFSIFDRKFGVSGAAGTDAFIKAIDQATAPLKA